MAEIESRRKRRRIAGRRPSREFSLQDLKALDFEWTLINGRVYNLSDFILIHPGGSLIWRAVGQDATELFHAHHYSQLAATALASCELGHVPDLLSEVAPLRAELNRRVAALEAPGTAAESVAISMLILFFLWAFLAYVQGWWVLNVLSSWFWWRHLDAGLHSAVHGDFRHSKLLQRRLLQVYSVLCHHMLDHYKKAVDGSSLSQHYLHHLHTNDFRLDPDWANFAVGRNWVRRHPCNPWQAYNCYQRFYWLPLRCLIEPLSEVFTMLSTCLNAAVQLLEPPDVKRFRALLQDVASWWLELMISPGYQGAAFLFRPFWSCLAVLLLAKAFAKLVLLPFAEVQHFLQPDAETDSEASKREEFVVRQLRASANLKLENPVIRFLDFLMFHGDSLQVEHHLWPAMSFVQLRAASKILRASCAELALPYSEVGYFEAYRRVWHQVRNHAEQPE